MAYPSGNIIFHPDFIPILLRVHERIETVKGGWLKNAKGNRVSEERPRIAEEVISRKNSARKILIKVQIVFRNSFIVASVTLNRESLICIKMERFRKILWNTNKL